MTPGQQAAQETREMRQALGLIRDPREIPPIMGGAAVVSLLPMLLAALPSLINGVSGIINAIRGAQETPAATKAHLDQLAADWTAMVRRVQTTPLPGD